jgi:amino acid transporter
MIFAAYVQAFLPLSEGQVRIIAAGVIVLLATANYRSMAWGVAIQNVSTAAKVLALLGLAMAVFALGDGSGGSLLGGAGPSGEIAAATNLTWAGFGTALIAVLWAYDGWADATYVAGEVKDPGKALPRALIGGFLTVVVVYLLLNAAYLYALPLEEVASSELVAADTATAVLGPVGSSLVAALVLLSTFGALNGTIMSGPRVFYAMGADRLFFRYFGALHPRGRTPHRAIALAAVLGVGFVSVRTFEELAEAFILGLWPFFMLAVLAVFHLRRRDPGRARPYRTLGYPVVPAIFLLVSVAILVSALVSEPLSTLFSFGMIVLGIPVFYGWRRIAPDPEVAPPGSDGSGS